ncbi:MAG TPA: prolyl oligopeptidase family serine peptidase [Casimicrobiaceae bacterium]
MLTTIGLADSLPYPETAKKPVSETFHGVTVVDNYRWLEDDRAPQVKQWTAAQNVLTRRYLDAIPQRAAIAKRVAQLLHSEPAQRYDFQYRKQLFAMKRQPPRNQPSLVALKPTAMLESERTVLDPLTIDPSGRTTIDFYRPSYDGRFVIVSLSQNGSEQGTAYVYDVATGKRLPDVIPGVAYPTAGGSVEWSNDGRGFWYTRYPQGVERPESERHFFQQVWFHTLGTPVASDRYAIGKEFPRIAETFLEGSRDGRYLLAIVRNGDGGEVAFHLRSPDESWSVVAGFADGVKQAAFGDDGHLYAMTINNAPLGKIIAIPLAKPSLAAARTVIPESKLVAESVVPTRARLYVTYRAGGPTLVRRFTLDGKAQGDIPGTPVSDIHVAERLDGDDVLVRTMSYIDPTTVSRYESRRSRLVRTQLDGRYDFNFDDATVVRDFAVSKDGTRIPVNIIQRKGITLDGSHPVLLYGYGGYGISMGPYFSPLRRLWLDWGGVFVIANVRGGGEFGEPWHLAGNLTKKQNVFDDFAACAQFLIDNKYTRPDKVAIMGGSNGGLLMGAMMTQHPELIRAAVSMVGIYDALHWEEQPNGAFNVTEFGSVKDADQFRALYAYSPYNNVKDGVPYPATLLTAGDNDGRVAPYESRKMVARLQAATSSTRPVLLRTEAAAGHGIGTALSTRIEENADIFAFLAGELAMQPVAPRTRSRQGLNAP